MSKVQPRDVSYIVQFIRRVLNSGRVTKNALRFEAEWAPRSQPEPNIPGGPHHKLSNNYYLARDARRQVRPPFVIADAAKAQQLEAQEAAKKLASS